MKQLDDPLLHLPTLFVGNGNDLVGLYPTYMFLLKRPVTVADLTNIDAILEAAKLFNL